MTLCPLQDFQRVPDRKRELDPGSSSQTQGDEKMDIPEGVQAGSEQNNSSPSTGKGEPVCNASRHYKPLLALPAAKTGDGFSVNEPHFALIVNTLTACDSPLLCALYIQFLFLDIFGFHKLAPISCMEASQKSLLSVSPI